MNSSIASSPRAQQSRRYLFGATWDFLLLGGGSLLALLAIRLALGADDDAKTLSLAATLALSNVVNHPHFAQSYMIFYRDFRKKITCYSLTLRLMYVFSGIGVPLALFAAMALTVATGSADKAGLAVNVMFFFVGWHYVKQGYGMAMVDAALKRAFFSDTEKRILRFNGYAIWITAWASVNGWQTAMDGRYWGIPFTPVAVAAPVHWCLLIAAAASSVATAWMLFKRAKRGVSTAWTGVTSYAISLYVWLLIPDPIVLLWIPLFHSLQYLTVVARFERNRAVARHSNARPWLRQALFFTTSILLGYLAFWVIPSHLDAVVPYDKSVYGHSLFIFLFWIFINVHHYFLDAVMWRQGNPDVAKHLFARDSADQLPARPQP